MTNIDQRNATTTYFEFFKEIKSRLKKGKNYQEIIKQF